MNLVLKLFEKKKSLQTPISCLGKTYRGPDDLRKKSGSAFKLGALRQGKSLLQLKQFSRQLH